jgi:hypothetical protein
LAIVIYEVSTAAIPDDDGEDEEKTIQARPAPVAHAGARPQKSFGTGHLRQARSRNSTASPKKKAGKAGNKKSGNSKNAPARQAGKRKQAVKAKKGTKQTNINKNREPVTNKRNQNQFKKKPPSQLDRQLKKNKPDYDDLDAEEEYIDYGPPQKAPSPGNMLIKKPNFAPDKTVPEPGFAVGQSGSDMKRIARPLPTFINTLPGGSDGMIEPAVMPPYYGRLDQPDLPPDFKSQPGDFIMRPAVMPPDYKEPTDGMMRPAVMPPDYKEPEDGLMRRRPPVMPPYYDESMPKVAVMPAPYEGDPPSSIDPAGTDIKSQEEQLKVLSTGNGPQPLLGGTGGIMALPAMVAPPIAQDTAKYASAEMPSSGKVGIVALPAMVA